MNRIVAETTLTALLISVGCSSENNPGGGGIPTGGDVVLNDPLAGVEIFPADNGTDMMIQGTMDDRWDNDVLNPAFHSLTAGDFEVVQLGWQP